MHPQVKGDFRDPQYWDPLMVSFPYYSHIFGDSYGSGMGIVWERGPNMGGPWKFHWLVKCIIFYSPKWQGDNVLPVKNAAHAHGTKTYCGSFKAWTLWASTDLQMPFTNYFNKARFQKLLGAWRRVIIMPQGSSCLRLIFLDGGPNRRCGWHPWWPWFEQSENASKRGTSGNVYEVDERQS